MQQDKREHARISTYQPLSILARGQSGVTGKMIELSAAGARFLCALAPETHAELEVVFSLPLKQANQEFRLHVRVIHSASVNTKPGTQANGMHAVGVEFIDISEREQILLAEYVIKVRSG